MTLLGQLQGRQRSSIYLNRWRVVEGDGDEGVYGAGPKDKGEVLGDAHHSRIARVGRIQRLGGVVGAPLLRPCRPLRIAQ